MDTIHPALHADRADPRGARAFLLLLAGYFLLQVVLRLLLSDSLDLDEAEQLYESQRLQLGYGTQPPLYNWLQWLAFAIFGKGLLALSALKNLCLFATYALVFRMALPLLGTLGAATVSASLLLLPQIGWESQRDLTHSVLLTTLACATLASYLWLLREPKPARYALLGALVGLGLQTKYNFAILTTGLVAASLLVPEHRRIFWNRKVLFAVAAGTVCLLPHGLWLLAHLDLAVGGTAEKIRGDGAGGYVANVARGAGSLLLATVAFLTPAWLVYVLACRRGLRHAAVDRGVEARFFLALYGACAACLALLVLTGDVTKVKDRWLQPLLVSAPLAFFVLLPACRGSQVYRRILACAGVAAALVLVAIPGRVLLGPALGKYARAHHPYPALATELAARFPQAAVVVTRDKLVAGNLHFQQPRWRTIALEDGQQPPQPLAGEVLLVAAAGEGDWLAPFLAALPRAEPLEQGQVALPFRYGRGPGTMSFHYARLRLPARSSP